MPMGCVILLLIGYVVRYCCEWGKLDICEGALRIPRIESLPDAGDVRPVFHHVEARRKARNT